jgi:hypothetical protein
VNLTTEKLGLYLPDGLHERMVQVAAQAQPQARGDGSVGRTYEQAFNELHAVLDAGQAVAFPAVRGVKGCRTIRLGANVCVRVRERHEQLNLKLTDFACTAVSRFLSTREGI